MIDCKERMPDFLKDVLVKLDSGDFAVACLMPTDEVGTWEASGGVRNGLLDGTPTHWMELPQEDQDLSAGFQLSGTMESMPPKEE